jgi:hypothetical protein
MIWVDPLRVYAEVHEMKKNDIMAKIAGMQDLTNFRNLHWEGSFCAGGSASGPHSIPTVV